VGEVAEEQVDRHGGMEDERQWGREIERRRRGRWGGGGGNEGGSVVANGSC
jgi:hypothetical protein